ncbi:MAG: hypothetical protein JSR78_08685 [Proteobacteria bacterium]|nr:hypothetical protein [Pseudomonadota bacterium]
MKKILIFAAAASSVMAAMPASFAHGVMRSDAELIKVLHTAAPAVIVDHATIMNMGDDGKMKVIQQGTNGWTCMDPGSHGNGETMCADKAAMAWADSWQNKKPPTAAIGFMYMLNGDSGVSNTDPYDTSPAPTPTNNWVQTGPHVMIVGTDAKGMIESYPKDAKADSSQPYVMWPGTPYEHLMIPVK